MITRWIKQLSIDETRQPLMGIAKFALLNCRTKRKSCPFAKLRCPVEVFCGSLRWLSSNAVQETPDTPSNSEEQEGLGARLSFVVQKLENIQKQKAEKMSALEKLRLWRNKTNIINTNSSNPTKGLGFEVEENEGTGEGIESQKGEVVETVPGEIAHPWPEWLDLMEVLVKQRYFHKLRGLNEEEDIVEKLSGGECTSRDECLNALEDDCADVFRDMRSVARACIDFGRDRFDILRFLSRKDIQILVGFGCPSIDKKVVLSGKRLRAFVRLDEGDVCSSCKLRNSCQEAYILPREEEAEARTIDVMRILMIYGLDPLINSAENKLYKKKVVKMAIRKLLKEVVRLSAVPIDPNLPKPVIKRLPPKVKEPQPPPRKRVGRDDVEMKKGDWLCPKCDFLNFAKNSLCLQCEGDRPRRLLNPGEWECPGCNYLNYRRNMSCYNCDHKRPEDDYTKSLAQGRDAKDSQQLQSPKRRLERPLNFRSSSKSWNDDFDDDESDGAEVASFEYGDNSKIAENPMIIANRGRKDSDSEDDSFDFDDLPMHGSKMMKPRNKDDDDLEIDTRPVIFKDRVNNFNKDDNEDASYSSSSRIKSSRSYERANMHSTYSRRNGRGYDSDEHLEAYQTKDSKKFATPSFSKHRGRQKKAYDSFDEDSDDDSFVSDSDDDETERKKGKKGRSMGGREWNKNVKRNSSREDTDDSDDEVSHLSRKKWETGKGAKFTGRDTSFSSRGRHGSRNEYGFENGRGAKSNHGRNRGKGNRTSRGDDSTIETRPTSESGEMLFGPRRGTRVKSDSDFEFELHNKKSRNVSSKRSSRSCDESSFRSRGGRMANSHGYVKEEYTEKINKASKNGRGGRRGQNGNNFVRDMF